MPKYMITDTAGLRSKLLNLWSDMENGKISPQEARTHIGFARATLDTLKVEIAAAHLNLPSIPAVSLDGPLKKPAIVKRAA